MRGPPYVDVPHCNHCSNPTDAWNMICAKCVRVTVHYRNLRQIEEDAIRLVQEDMDSRDRAEYEQARQELLELYQSDLPGPPWRERFARISRAFRDSGQCSWRGLVDSVCEECKRLETERIDLGHNIRSCPDGKLNPQRIAVDWKEEQHD